MARKILITGKNSYIGSSFADWIAKNEPNSECVSISVRGQEWRDIDFSKFDTVLYVAGIAHQKEKKSNQESYFEINHELTVQVAIKAKENNVTNFVFLNTMSVFGKTTGHIGKNTITNPNNNYEKSKLQAEIDLMQMSNRDFKVSIVRPPLVYGTNCRGNYGLLEKAAKVLLIFPNIKNERSMIDIDLLSFSLYNIMHENGGYYHPQDKEYSCTTDLVRNLSENYGRKIYFTKCFNIPLTKSNITLFNKIFGNLTYDMKIDIHNNEEDKVKNI